MGPGAGPEAPPAAPAYGGPVPPGGWQQPVARAEGGWSGGVQLAGWGARVGATIIDGLVLAIPAGILFFLVVGSAIGLTGGDEDAASVVAVLGALALFTLLVAVISLAYAPVLMSRGGARNGQTWGKQVTGIRVTRDNGQPFTFAWAALREVVIKALGVGIASSFTFGLAYFADVLWPLWDDQNRALHDMAASTHVVKA